MTLAPTRFRRPGGLPPLPITVWEPPAGAAWMRGVRAVRRGVLLAAWTAVMIPVQAVCLLLPGRAKIVVPTVYWAGMSRLIGLRVRVLGQAVHPRGRPVVFASNHSSWLDILVLGGVLEACFVAKTEVGRWPVIRTVARLGRTVFVSRRVRDTGRERDDMRDRLRAGDNLLLFPEGTSNDGSRVLPFRSAFFSVTDPAEGVPRPVVQPVSVVYDRLGGLPVGRAVRPLFAWYGDMELGSHYWRLGGERGMRATVVLHPPLDPADFPSRKALNEAAWDVVANGASRLRQNREVVSGV